MNDERAKRKLSAILSADVKGYSRLMEEDEASTIRNLEESKKLMGKLIEQFKGRVVDSPGDNLLAEFGSVVDATDCAIKIQQELKIKNADLPENRRLEFRIGINLGDVVEEEDRIYGDGVNIAARIEGLAKPGGVCISRTTYDQVKTKLNLGYEYLGEQAVKNIVEPVRVYRVLTEPEAAGKVIGEKRFLGKISRKAAIAAVIVFIIVVGGLICWNLYLHLSRKVEAASIDKMAYPLPDKPSIAVLPFDNLSGDPDQEYFSDGLTEEIITGLSKIPDLFVIARNSSFYYKGKPVKIQQVSEELGVRYVLEGSVRRESDRVRITAQLIDAIKGYHLWSERYDREFKDILALQEEIMTKILIEMRVKLTSGEQAGVRIKTYKGKEFNLEAYLKRMQALWYFNKSTPDENTIARQLFEESIEIEPSPLAYAMLAWTHLIDMSYGTSKSPLKSIELAEEFARKALQLDDSDPAGRIVLARIYITKHKYDDAIAEARKALELDPNGSATNYLMGFFLHFAGSHEEALPLFKKAIRLNPYPPGSYYWLIGASYSFLERYDEAINEYKKGLKREPNNFWVHLFLMVAYCMQERLEDARAEVLEVLSINPQYSIKIFEEQWIYKDKKALKTWEECCRKAGLPEG